MVGMMSAPRPRGKGKPVSVGPRGKIARRLSAPPRRTEPFRIAFAFALATATLVLVPFINAAPPPPPAGAAPDFTLNTTAGSLYTLSSDLGHEPVFVEFMHPDCSHCRAMGPVLEDAFMQFGSRVHFVTVAVRLPGFTNPTLSTVSAFAAEFGHGWTYGLDQQTRARDLYHVQGTPTFVFIARDGLIAHTAAGELSASELQGRLAALLGG